MDETKEVGAENEEREARRGSQNAETNQTGQVSEFLGAALHEI